MSEARYRATARMVAAWNLTWDEAEHAVDHTMTGTLALLEESLRELGRVIAKTARDDAAAVRRFGRKVTRLG